MYDNPDVYKAFSVIYATATVNNMTVIQKSDMTDMTVIQKSEG